MRVVVTIAAITLMGWATSTLGGIPDPETIRSVLIKGDEPAVTQLAKSLGITTPKEWVGRATDEPCADFDSVNIDRISLYGPNNQAVITVHAPSLCKMAFVVILDKAAAGDWQLIDTLRFREHHAAPTVSFEKLISPDLSEIVVKNNEVDYGTGIENIRMTIYSINASGARVIFDEPTELIWALAMSKGGKQDNTDQSESDEYTFLDDKDQVGKFTGFKYIHRVETIKDHEVQIVRYWDYDWDPVYRKLMGYQASGPK